MGDSKDRGAGPARGLHWRLTVLLAIMVALAVAGVVHLDVVRYYEAQLHDIAVGLVEAENAADKEPLSEQGPEAWVEIDTTVSFAYVLFGEKTGKITLTIHPYPHAKVQDLGGISYIYAHEGGEWKQEMSYHEEF